MEFGGDQIFFPSFSSCPRFAFQASGPSVPVGSTAASAYSKDQKDWKTYQGNGKNMKELCNYVYFLSVFLQKERG